jgi:hypothetical protein
MISIMEEIAPTARMTLLTGRKKRPEDAAAFTICVPALTGTIADLLCACANSCRHGALV